MANDPTFRDELMKAVNRMIDRFVPEFSRKYEKPNRQESNLAAFLGAVVWASAALVYMIQIDNLPYYPNFGFSFSFFLWFVGTSLIACLAFTLLIVRSFDRGRPLTFFLRGLIFPTPALTVLEFAFPS